MNKLFFSALLFLFLFIQTEISFASHAVGADLTYVCMGGNNYRFFFTLYRDCQGIMVETSYNISGTSTCGDTISIIVSQDSVRETIHTCSSVITSCVNFGSPYMGIEANYYHGDITLPSFCDSWTFGLSPAICNRNAAINNLDPNGSTYCLYVKATLNNLAFQCNSSPTFESAPAQFLYANQVQYYVEHAYDIDGDSLSYQMITPHSDSVTDVQYLPGLSATQPVYYNTATVFNSQTGDVRFNASNAQITVMAIEVSEYRNGILVGSVERDIELIFENSNNALPTASGINGSIIYSTHVCADSLLSFYINTNDADAADQTYISWNGGIPGATFYSAGTFRDIGYFTWLPGIQDARPQPYIFTVTVTDNACPSLGMNSYSYAIYVDSCFSTGINPVSGVQSFSANYAEADESIHFKYRLDQEHAMTLSLYDLTGRELKKIFLEKTAGDDAALYVPELSAGVYLVSLKCAEGNSQRIKVVVE